MEQHRLRREIIATAVTNSMVNRMGATFVLRMQEDTGETPAQIAKAYTITPRGAGRARVVGAASTRSTARSPETAQIDALQRDLAPAAQLHALAAQPAGRDLDIATTVERYATASDGDPRGRCASCPDSQRPAVRRPSMQRLERAGAVAGDSPNSWPRCRT